MANPPGNQPGTDHGFNRAHLNNGNLIAETSAASVLNHDPGISVDWTLEEQAKLEDGLTELPVDLEPIIRYAKIAMSLPNKTVRDVAMRCRWMTKKENNRRRKEERNLARKSKDRRERFIDPSVKYTLFAAQPNPSPYPTPMIPMDSNDGFSCRDIGGGLTGELLQQNAQALDQISANLATFQVQDNITLLIQTRDNILKLMNALNDVPNKMKQMPPLPVTINHELANAILPPPSHHMQQS